MDQLDRLAPFVGTWDVDARFPGARPGDVTASPDFDKMWPSRKAREALTCMFVLQRRV